MAIINEEAFDEVSSKAQLKDKSINQDIQRYVMVYDVPKVWIQALKENKLKSSQYFKQAVLEKLQRDKMI
jgi:ABC-type branched-subunit amino acid transport system substrate-binding protein